MMHISRLWEANVLDTRLRQKQSEREMIASGKGLGITFQGKYQPDDLVDAVRMGVLAYLDGQIADTTAELTLLGLDMSASPVG